MRLAHFSDRTDLELAQLEVCEQTTGPKPRGFWLSDEGSDTSWSLVCKVNEWDFIAEHAYAVELAQDAKILHLASDEAMRLFNAKFGTNKLLPGLDLGRVSMTMFVDWPAVAQEWDGILITPYRWSRRLSDLSWYYGWDCASGCVWNPRAITTVTREDAPSAVR